MTLNKQKQQKILQFCTEINKTRQTQSALHEIPNKTVSEHVTQFKTAFGDKQRNTTQTICKRNLTKVA